MSFIKRKFDEDPANGAGADARTAISPLPPNPLQTTKHNGQNRSVIDSRLVITGVLEGDGELQVEGKVEGDIRCSHLIVGREASIKGKIAADEVIVRGAVTGAIGANRVILADGARVESDIFHKRLSIEEGADFEGWVGCREHPIDEMRAAAAQKGKVSAPAEKGKASAADKAAAATPGTGTREAVPSPGR
jgi:cytoskeletal protein CcmA (bactofilin family)